MPKNSLFLLIKSTRDWGSALRPLASGGRPQTPELALLPSWRIPGYVPARTRYFPFHVQTRCDPSEVKIT